MVPGRSGGDADPGAGRQMVVRRAAYADEGRRLRADVRGYRATDDRLRLVLVKTLESAGHVFFGRVAEVVERAGWSKLLKYFSFSHLEVEKNHQVFEDEISAHRGGDPAGTEGCAPKPSSSSIAVTPPSRTMFDALSAPERPPDGGDTRGNATGHPRRHAAGHRSCTFLPRSVRHATFASAASDSIDVACPCSRGGRRVQLPAGGPMDTKQNLTLSIAARSPQELLGQMSRLYVLSRSIHTIAELGVANLIGDAPVSAPDVARAAGVSSEYLSRCLRYLAAYGVFEETSHNWFRATALSRSHAGQSPKSMRPVLRMVSSEWWDAVGPASRGHPQRAVRNRAGSRRQLFRSAQASRPELQRRFNEGMSSISRMDDETLAAAYDFSGEGVVADLAGGRGELSPRGSTKEPRAERGAVRAAPGACGVDACWTNTCGTGRVRLVPGNLFEVLPAPADIYVNQGDSSRFRRSAGDRDSAQLRKRHAARPTGS